MFSSSFLTPCLSKILSPGLSIFKPTVHINWLICFSVRLHSHKYTHAALNLTHPGGIKCHTVSAFLVCVIRGSAKRRTNVHSEDKMTRRSAATNQTDEAGARHWQSIFTFAFRGREDEDINKIIQEVKGRERRRGRWGGWIHGDRAAAAELTERSRVRYRAWGT